METKNIEEDKMTDKRRFVADDYGTPVCTEKPEAYVVDDYGDIPKTLYSFVTDDYGNSVRVSHARPCSENF